MLLVLAAREHGDRFDEVGPLLLPVLLEEPLAADAVGHADHRQRPIGEVRQHVRRHLREVAQQVALGERRLVLRRIGRPVDAIEMGERDAVLADRERERVLRGVELRQDVVDRAAGRAGAACAGADCRTPHRLRIDVVAQAQEHRRAQVAVVGPALEAHFGDELRLDPGRRRVELRRFGERARLRAAAARAAP